MKKSLPWALRIGQRPLLKDVMRKVLAPKTDLAEWAGLQAADQLEECLVELACRTCRVGQVQSEHQMQALRNPQQVVLILLTMRPLKKCWKLIKPMLQKSKQGTNTETILSICTIRWIILTQWTLKIRYGRRLSWAPLRAICQCLLP